MAKKPTNNKPQKKLPKIPGLPKDANVKSIEITPRTLLLPILIIALIWAVYSSWSGYGPEKVTYNNTVGLNEIQARYESGTYEEIVVDGNKIEAKKQKTTNFVNGVQVSSREVDRTTLPDNLKITDIGLSDPKNPTKVTIKNTDFARAFWDIIPSVVGTVLFVIILFFVISRMGGGGMGGPMAFIRSRARVYDPENDEKITFVDVAGAEEEKSDLEEVVDFLKNPKKYKDLGAKIPRGILLQ